MNEVIMTTNTKNFFSVPEAAVELCVSQQKIFLMLKNQELGYMKIGHRTIIPKQAIDDYLEQNFRAASGKI